MYIDICIDFQLLSTHFETIPCLLFLLLSTVLRMRSSDKNRENLIGKFFVHTMQILPRMSCRAMETMKILPVNSENETTLHFICQVSVTK